MCLMEIIFQRVIDLSVSTCVMQQKNLSALIGDVFRIP